MDPGEVGAGGRAARRGPLHEAEIVQKALEIIRSDGVDGLTMRRLSDSLGVAVGATYKHVPTKDDLLRLVTIELYSRIGPCRPVGPDWCAGVRLFLTRFREVVCAHPGMASYISAHRTEAAPYRLHESLINTLRGAGFSAAGTESVIRVLFFYVSGAVLIPPALTLGARAEAEFVDGLDVVLVGIRHALAQEPHAIAG